MSGNTSQNNFAQVNLDALAVGRYPYHPLVFNAGNPTPQNVNYPIRQIWINTLTDEAWVLEAFASTAGVVTATWSKFGSGIFTVEALQGNTGDPVNPDVNHVIHTIGAAPYVVNGNPATNTLTWTDNGGIAYTYTEDSGTAQPAANNLNIFGTDDVIKTSGSGSTVTINAGGKIATSYPCDTGTAVPSGNVLNVLGGAAIHTTGSGNTITIAATGFAINYTNVTHAMSPYTVLTTDYYISVDCSGGVVTLNFPNAPSAKQIWIVKDRTGNATANNISITTPGGVVTIDGLTTYKLASNFASVNILANATPTYEIF